MKEGVQDRPVGNGLSDSKASMGVFRKLITIRTKMKPIVFGGRFGWLHPGNGDRGVVLCNSFGHEYVWTHKGMRRLADELSARGIWVLRFDYRGTGDSAGA